MTPECRVIKSGEEELSELYKQQRCGSAFLFVKQSVWQTEQHWNMVEGLLSSDSSPSVIPEGTNNGFVDQIRFPALKASGAVYPGGVGSHRINVPGPTVWRRIV